MYLITKELILALVTRSWPDFNDPIANGYIVLILLYVVDSQSNSASRTWYVRMDGGGIHLRREL